MGEHTQQLNQLSNKQPDERWDLATVQPGLSTTADRQHFEQQRSRDGWARPTLTASLRARRSSSLSPRFPMTCSCCRASRTAVLAEHRAAGRLALRRQAAASMQGRDGQAAAAAVGAAAAAAAATGRRAVATQRARGDSLISQTATETAGRRAGGRTRAERALEERWAAESLQYEACDRWMLV